MPAVEEEEHCSFETSASFATLSVVRGTTPLVMFYAVYYLPSPALVVALKCAVSLCLFVLSAVFLLRKPAVRTVILSNLTTKSTYWKLFCVGLFQSAVPYLLAVYAVQYVPITMNTVFMVTTPWWIFLFERCSRPRNGRRIPFVFKAGMVLGLLGIVIMIVPIFIETAQCVDHQKDPQKNTTSINNKIYGTLGDESALLGTTLDYCHSFTDVSTGIISCLLAPLLWGIAAVFWKRNQGGIHHIVGSIGQNVFGGVIAGMVWGIVGMATAFEPIPWGAKQWIGCIIYLGAATGWIGTFLVRYLSTKLGSKTINQVLTGIPLITFIEDCLFIRDLVTRHSYTLLIELFGLILVTAGVFVSNIPRDDVGVSRLNTNSRNIGTTERLLGTTDYDNRGLDDDSNETLRNQIGQYERHAGYDVHEDGERNSHVDNESVEGPMNVETKVKYPLLTEVS